jgi:RNA polymerase primary sigma factor
MGFRRRAPTVAAEATMASDQNARRSPPGRAGRRSSWTAGSTSEASRARKLLRAARRGDRGARERLVVANLTLVRSVASHYRGLGLPFDDLVQEGSLGLLEAIDHYDSARSADFERYARFRIRRAIRNALTEQTRLVRLPKHIVERRRTIERTEAQLTAAANGRRPTPSQLAAVTGLPLAAVLETRAVGFPPISLDAAVLPDGTPLEAGIVDPRARDPELEALEHERTELLLNALDRLSERERRLVNRHWGLDGTARTTAELSAELELSPRRTQAIERDALYELRAALR